MLVSYGLPSVDLKPPSVEAEILQNIKTILSAPLGSVPLARDFGLDLSFLDKPEPVARVMLTSAIADALENFEPRAEIVNITIAREPDGFGLFRLVPKLEVRLRE